MGKVVEIGISQNFKGQIQSVNSVEALAGQGITNDRHCKKNNDVKCQITLIELENINHYNKLYKTDISPINFRRNIITKGVKLNDLLGKEFFVGDVKLKGHDLCRPCKPLQDGLKQKNLIKEFLQKGGLRCEILTSGKIFLGSLIKIKM